MIDRSHYPLDVNFFNLLIWAYKTAKEDCYYYKDRPRPRQISAHRIASSVFPHLSGSVFIIGSPRSGTTFLGECIASLPEVSYHHEPIAIKGAARHVYMNHWSFPKARFYYRAVYRWLKRIHADGDLRLAEKTPRNCLIMSFLYRVFPDARFVYIVRDCRDAALSHSKKPWLSSKASGSGRIEPGGYPHGPSARFWVEEDRRKEFENTSDIHRCAWNWRIYNEHVIRELPLMPESRLLMLKYENLVTDQKKWGNRILDFLEIDRQRSRSVFHEKIESGNARSIGLWKKELHSPELVQIYKESGELMDMFGYIRK